MSKIVWDQIGERYYETGVDHGVLYQYDTDAKAYNSGVAWNGLSEISESPSGAEASAVYADNIKYLNLVSNEEFGFTINAYTYPDEFMANDGSIALKGGVYLGQQKRKTFGLTYRTTLGNDTELNDYGYKLHLVYGCLAAPSSKTYSTINDSPEAASMSWEVKTTPVAVSSNDGQTFRPVSTIVIDSTKVTAESLKKLEDILYGSDEAEPRLPLPDEVISTLVNKGIS